MVLETLVRWPSRLWASNKDDPFEPTPLPVLALQAPLKLILYHAYHFIISLRSLPSPRETPIKVVCISDTHTKYVENVPDGDILIHAGDMTNDGSIEEIQRQIDWLASLPHKEVVVIAGNHDTFLDPRTRPSLPEHKRTGSIDWKRVHYLQHRRLNLTIDVGASSPNLASSEDSETTRLLPAAKTRRLVVYGAPQIPACGPMSIHAFQYERGRDAWSETVPEDTNILITHTPPKYYRDLPLPSGLGCEHLAKEVSRVKPALHVFGHVHWGAGTEVIWWDDTHNAYEKGIQVQTRWFLGLLNLRVWMSVLKVCYRGLRGLIWDKVWGGVGPNTILVNAAQMHGNTGKLGNSVQVVEI